MTLATSIRDNKALNVAIGAGDLAGEKLRDLPDTVAKLRETAAKVQDDVRENVSKARHDVRGTVTRYQDELRSNVSKLRDRVDTGDLPGAAASYVTHSASRLVEIIDELAERGRKVQAHPEEIETAQAAPKPAPRQVKSAAAEPKKTTTAAARKPGTTAKS